MYVARGLDYHGFLFFFKDFIDSFKSESMRVHAQVHAAWVHGGEAGEQQGRRKRDKQTRRAPCHDPEIKT